MKTVQITGLAVALVFLLAFFVMADEAAKGPHPQTVCPVMGGEIDKDVYIDYEGKRVYFCCPMCIDKFKADPAMYIKKLEDEGVVLEKAPEGGEPGAETHHEGHGHMKHSGE